MRTIIHTSKLDGLSDWSDKRSRIDDSTVCLFDLKNGFKPRLKKDGNKFVDFRKNRYVLDYRNGELILYKKHTEDSTLEELSKVSKIVIEE
jgi:uncharacterized protein involved in tellurium resistance